MRTYSEKEALEIGDWLSNLPSPNQWSCFHTATFSPENPSRSPWQAAERYRRFMQEKDRRKVTWVAGIEPNPDHSGLNPGFHVHAMWAACEGVWRTSSFARWSEQWGNNRLESIKNSEHVRRYVAKYCLKEGALWELEINDPLLYRAQLLPVVNVASRKGYDKAVA